MKVRISPLNILLRTFIQKFIQISAQIIQYENQEKMIILTDFSLFTNFN